MKREACFSSDSGSLSMIYNRRVGDFVRREYKCGVWPDCVGRHIILIDGMDDKTRCRDEIHGTSFYV